MSISLPRWRPTLLGLLAIDIGLLALHLIGLAAGSSLLDMTEEGNLPTWFSSAQFLAAGAACYAAAGTADAQRLGWLALGAVMALFSLDEIAGLHERFETRAGAETVILVVEPLLALLLILGVWSVVRSRPGAVRPLLAGAMLAVALAVGVSAVNEALDPGALVRDVLAAAEELAELLTGTLVLAAALASAEATAQSSKKA